MTPANAEILKKLMIIEEELTKINKLSRDLLEDEIKLEGGYNRLLKRLNEQD